MLKNAQIRALLRLRCDIQPGVVQTDMGGANAALTPEQSIGGMRKVLAGDPMQLIGKFLSHDGSIWPWWYQLAANA